jgi:hypothetical protein
MQTVTFKCPHCNKLMGVGAAFLGQQVRCPHCRNVLMAPAAAPPPAPAAPPPAPSSPLPDLFTPGVPQQEQESIFGPPPVDEDLFGGSPAPRLEIPPQPTLPQAPRPLPVEPTAAVPPRPPEPAPLPPPGAIFGPPQGEATLTYVPQEGLTTPDAGVHVNELVDQGAAPQQELPPTLAEAGLPDGDEVERVFTAAPPRPSLQRKPGGGGWVLAVIIVPLVSYSIGITILFLMLYLQPKPRDPLEGIPDTGNVNPGAKKARPTSIKWGTQPLLPLPDKLKVRLGETLVVGDLAVKPRKVELRPVSISRRPDPNIYPLGKDPLLVLYLELQNVSRDVEFYPLDPFFDREWTLLVDENMPFTYLVKGNKHFAGGPAKLSVSARDPIREDLWLVGTEENPEEKLSQQADQELKPGQKMETFVCTAPHHHIDQELDGYEGPLLYRVQLRRGLVAVKGEDVSATCVVGVVFTGKDVKRVVLKEKAG